ncbi:OmpA family protein [Xylophilus sp. Kf1]|nr:OmpA family protein [Xylophilus sp. Kf1]
MINELDHRFIPVNQQLIHGCSHLAHIPSAPSVDIVESTFRMFPQRRTAFRSLRVQSRDDLRLTTHSCAHNCIERSANKALHFGIHRTSRPPHSAPPSHFPFPIPLIEMPRALSIPFQGKPMRSPATAISSHSKRAFSTRWAVALILGSVLGLATGAHAQTRLPLRAPVEQDAKIPTLVAGRSAIVFLKQQSSVHSPDGNGRDETVSVFVDGTYHASLPKPSWSYAEVCPGPHAVKAVQDRNILAVTEQQPPGRSYQFPAASTTFFEVRDDIHGLPQIETVDAAEATAAVAQLPRAVHTISRLQTGACTSVADVAPAPAPVAAPTTTTRYTLRASTFFDFDDAGMRSKDGKSSAELDQIIQKVHANYMTVENIDVIGYADPTGSATYNLDLSRKRAETVARYLANADFPSAVITPRGMGATHLAVSGCAARSKTPQELHACNEPNRRVELIVNGHLKN